LTPPVKPLALNLILFIDLIWRAFGDLQLCIVPEMIKKLLIIPIFVAVGLVFVFQEAELRQWNVTVDFKVIFGEPIFPAKLATNLAEHVGMPSDSKIVNKNLSSKTG
jgi:hypothetical protein